MARRIPTACGRGPNTARRARGAWCSLEVERRMGGPMRGIVLVGIALIVLGVVALAWQGITYTSTEDRRRVLTEQRWRRRGLSRRRVEPDGHAHDRDVAGFRMTQAHHHSARFQVIALAHLGDRLDAPGRDTGRLQALEPLVGPARAE